MAGHTVPEIVYVGGGCTNIRVDSAGWCGVGVVNLAIGGLFYLGVYLTLSPILGSVEKQDIMNLRTLLGGTREFGVTKRKPVRYGAFARRRRSQRKLKTEYCISLQDRNGRLHLITRVKRG